MAEVVDLDNGFLETAAERILGTVETKVNRLMKHSERVRVGR